MKAQKELIAPIPRSVRRRVLRFAATTGLAGLGVLCGTSEAAPTPEKNEGKTSSAVDNIKKELEQVYKPGSVKLTAAHATGEVPFLSDSAPAREIVTGHIDFKLSGMAANRKRHRPYFFGDNIPPKETVIGPGHSTRPGVTNWVTSPPDGDIDMQVYLGPYLGHGETTRKYRLFLSVISEHRYNKKYYATENYAGTVVVGGNNGLIDSVMIEHEKNIPPIQVISSANFSTLVGPSNANPHAG